jgi:hypothetical protein
MSSGQQNLASGVGRGRRRGWLLVATLAASETTAYGVLAYAFGVFLLPVQQELGWSRTALTGAAAASLLVLGWSQVSDLGVFYGIWVGIGLTMAAVLYEPAFAVIASWYRDAAERTRALLGLDRDRRVRQCHLRPPGRLAGPDPRVAPRPGCARGAPGRPYRAAQRHPAWPAT